MLPGMLPRTGKPLTLGRSFSTKLLIYLAPRAGYAPVNEISGLHCPLPSNATRQRKDISEAPATLNCRPNGRRNTGMANISTSAS
jgi:hypothetical protein